MAELVTNGSSDNGSRRFAIRRRVAIWVTAALVIGGLAALGVYRAVAGGPSAPAIAEGDVPARLEPIGKTGLTRVVLSASAARRLGITTVPVSSVLVNGKRRTAIPYAAVLYDPNGDEWTFTSPRPLVFVRRDIRVDFVRGDLAVLSEGPSPGTAVVTVGSAELLGVEVGDIEED